MTIELLIVAGVVLAVLLVGRRFLRGVTWKRKTKKLGPVRVTVQGPRLVSAYVDMWLWKRQLYPRKARR
jgi:hypothetical protein